MAAFQLSTYVRLGDEHHVIETGQATLSAVAQGREHKKAAIVYADITQAQLQIGDIAKGVTYARRALEAAQRSESTWGIQHLATVEKALAPHSDHTVREDGPERPESRRAAG
jgi:hypothetical protein